MTDFSAQETCDSGSTAPFRAPTRESDSPGARSALPFALVLCLWAAVALVYWPSALELHRLWTDWPAETYTHGYLLFLLSIWLVIRERERLALTPVRAQPLGLIPLVLMSAAWVWSWRAAIQEPQLLLLPLILYCALYAALGRRMARALAFPIGFLYFAMPLWSDINTVVQGLSAKVTGVLIWITGIPAYMAGNMVHLPGGNIEIAESCSGLHTFIVGLALAAFYGKVSGEPWRRRLAWLGSMAVLSLMVNWVRIFTVIVAAYETEMRSSLVKSHYWLGWWLFTFAFAGFLFWTTRRSAAPRRGSAAGAEQRTSAAPSGVGIRPANVFAALAALAIVPAFAYGMDWTRASTTAASIDVRWPAPPAGWGGPAVESGGDWKPYFVNPSGESLMRYTAPNNQMVEAFAVAYRVQTQQAKLLGYWNRLAGRDKGIRTLSTRIVNSRDGQWSETTVIDRGGSRALIWTRYRVGNRLFVSPRASQLWYGFAAIVRPPVSSLLALRASCVPDCRGARSRLSEVGAWLQPGLL